MTVVARRNVHRDPVDTELAAAAAQTGAKERNDRLRVLHMANDAGYHGVTAYELKRDWEPAWVNTPAARLTNLKEDGCVEDSGRRRRTNTNKTAVVHVITRKGRDELRDAGWT